MPILRFFPGDSDLGVIPTGESADQKDSHFVAESAPFVRLESKTGHRSDAMFLRWLDDSPRDMIGMSASRKRRRASLFTGLAVTALSCAVVSAQDGAHLPADFQNQRANSASLIPINYSVGATQPAAVPPVPGTSTPNIHDTAPHPTDGVEVHLDHAVHDNHDALEHLHLNDHDDGHGTSHGGHGGSHGGHGDAGHGSSHHLEIPPMIGSFSRGPGRGRLMFPIDRLIVVPQDNALGALGAGNAPVTFSGAGPVNINRPGTVSTIGGLQTLFRQQLRLPPQNVVGTIADTATFTTTQTLDEVNAAFAATLQPYDVVGVQAPPGTYNTAVDIAFQAANTVNGQTVFDPTTSGVIRSGRTESVAPLNQPLGAGQMLDAFYAFDYVVNVPIPSPSADGLLGRSSVGANSSAVPTDRLYFDYSLIKNGVPFNRSENFDRYTIGIEKTIGEGDFSLEVRLPFAASMDHQLILENGRGAAQTET